MIDSVTDSMTRATCSKGRGAAAKLRAPSRQISGESSSKAAMLRISSICHTEYVVSSHLPSASLPQNRKMPSTISPMPASVAERWFDEVCEGEVMASRRRRTLCPAPRDRKLHAGRSLPVQAREHKSVLRGFELASEIFQLIGVQVADRPERKSRLAP